MRRDEILEKLRADKPALDAFGVSRIGVFGSVARGKADAESDIDVVVDFRADAAPSLLDFADLQHHLEDVLGTRVDLTTRKALHPAMSKQILADTVYA